MNIHQKNKPGKTSRPHLKGWLATTIILISVYHSVHTQPQLYNNFEENFITIDASSPNLWEGEYREFRIPDDPITEYLHFRVRGGDGGEAKTGSASTPGGDGALIEFDIKIGNGPNEIPAGSTLRFVVGKSGQGHTVSAAGLALGGGGGGTGILLVGDGSFDEILAIAGGGGGAYRSGTWGSAPGQGGRSGTSGGDGEGDDGAPGGINGEPAHGNSAGSGGAWFSGGAEGGISGGAGISALGCWGGETSTGGNGGWGCGGGGAASLNGLTAGSGGGGGYSSGGGSGGVQRPVRAGGGGSYLNTDHVFNSNITAGGAGGNTEFGIVSYQFYCSARFSDNVTVTREVYCYGAETIQMAVETPQWLCADISYKRKDNNEINTTGIFAGLLPEISYEFELYYDNERVDEIIHTVGNDFDDEDPTVFCSGNLAFDIRQTPNPVIELADVHTGSTDNCGISEVTIVGYGNSRSFSCDELGDHIVTLRSTDFVGNTGNCSFTVSINNGYPSGVSVFPLSVELDENGALQIHEGDLQFTSEAGSCFTFDEIYANYRIPAAYRILNCDDLGIHDIQLEEVDPNFPDVILELRVEDNVPIQATVADVSIALDDTGVGTLSFDELNFTVSDNCLSDAEIIANYSLPADAQHFDCTDIGTSVVFLDKDDDSFPAVPVQITVISTDLSLDPVNASFCSGQNFDLTSLEDEITSGAGIFTYTKSIERLYIPNRDDHTVSVIDLATNTIIKTIAVGDRPIGVAVSPNKAEVYITNSGGSSVSVIDIASNMLVQTITGVGNKPFGIVFNSDGSRAYVANQDISGAVSIINTDTRTVLNTINVGNYPNGLSISPDNSKLYVVRETSDDVAVIKLNNNIFTTTKVENIPNNAVLSANGTKVYVSCAAFHNPNTKGAISVIDIATDKVETTLQFNVQKPQGLAVSPTGDLFAGHSSGGGYLSRIEPGNGNQITTTAIEESIFNEFLGASINTDGTMLYLVDILQNKVLLINTVNNTITATIPVGNRPYCLGKFYVKTDIEIADPATYPPNDGEVINVAFDGGGDCAATTTITLTGTACQTLALKANLEGAYNTTTGLMNVNLRSLANFPISQGNYQIEEGVLDISGKNAIVDWVTISLRDALDNTVIIFTRPALLQADGDVVDMDGVSPIHCQPGLNGTYHVVLDHRNHLGLMTANTQAFSHPSIAISIDFTRVSLSVFGSASRVELEAGIWGCFAADVDGSGAINAFDRSMTWNDRNQSGYLNTDCNLDGITNANDRSAAWNNRNKGGTLPE